MDAELKRFLNEIAALNPRNTNSSGQVEVGPGRIADMVATATRLLEKLDK
jgi:hypothetical protein